MIEVRLEIDEIRLAAQGGIERHLWRLEKRPEMKNKFGDEHWEPDIVGAIAEYAVAKAFGIFWKPTVGELCVRDVGPLEVRASVAGPCMVLYPNNPEDAPFVFVLGGPPVLRIVGWIMGRDGKCREYWRDEPSVRKAGFFVPQSKLRPLKELRLLKLAAA